MAQELHRAKPSTFKVWDNLVAILNIHRDLVTSLRL